MEDLPDSLLFDEALSSEQRKLLRQKMEEEPELVSAWTGWQQVRARLRERLREHVLDRRLLVLYALEQEGYGAALTAEERQFLDASREDLSRAIDALPGLEHVVERIQDERAEFEAMWRQHRDASAPASSESARSPRPDRAPRAPQSRNERTLLGWGRRLALAALLVGVGILALFFWPQEASQTTIEVGENEQRVVELSDGSTVRLRGAATLSYSSEALAEGERRVALEEGRAFFHVTPPENEAGTFIVETPTATASVLSTQFGVTTGGDTTEVVLATGQVRFGSDGEADEQGIVLEPGERSVVQDGQPPTSPASVDLTSALDWTGLFVFRSVPLEAIAQRLSEHYGVSITVAPALLDEPVTGTFEREQPVDQVLATLAATLGAEIERRDATYHVAGP